MSLSRTELAQHIRTALAEHADLADALTLPGSDSLAVRGLNSHATVNLVVALEEDLDFEFPDDLFTRENFASIDAIAAVIGRLLAHA